jgi:hypothetical protein
VVTQNKASDEHQAYEKSTESISADSKAKAATEKGKRMRAKGMRQRIVTMGRMSRRIYCAEERQGGKASIRNLADWQQKQRAEREAEAMIRGRG